MILTFPFRKDARRDCWRGTHSSFHKKTKTLREIARFPQQKKKNLASKWTRKARRGKWRTREREIREGEEKQVCWWPQGMMMQSVVGRPAKTELRDSTHSKKGDQRDGNGTTTKIVEMGTRGRKSISQHFFTINFAIRICYIFCYKAHWRGEERMIGIKWPKNGNNEGSAIQNAGWAIF